MRRIRLLLSVGIICAAILALFFLGTVRRPPHVYLEGMRTQVQVMAHQGGDRLWPSNTLYAFERAAELGVDVGAIAA